MAQRAVTGSGKDGRGNITGLCGPWGSVSSNAAIVEINMGVHHYFVDWQGGKRTDVRVVNGPNGPYLRTDWDDTERNNLDDLRDC